MSPTPAEPRRAAVPPVVAALRRLSSAAWAALVVGLVLVAVLVLAVANPGDRVGPVEPAVPPVDGTDLPAG